MSSSLRMGLPARPNEGRAQRLADAKSMGGLPRPVNRSTKYQGEPGSSSIDRTPSQTSTSRIPSRVPQPTSTRPQPRPQATPKLSSARQSTSWGSESTNASATSNSHTQSGSSSSASTRSYESSQRPPRNVLRRKESLVSQTPATAFQEHQIMEPLRPAARFDEPVDASPYTAFVQQSDYQTAEVDLMQSPEPMEGLTQSPVIYPELDRYRNYRAYNPPSDAYADIPYKLSTHDLPPPTPVSLPFSGSSSQLSASPSTKFSGSPGPGWYSRETTPTSISSHSPGITIPNRANVFKDRQFSPNQTRPPVSRWISGNETDAVDPQGLAAVRESLNSSSSSSTVKDGDRNNKEKKQKRRLPPPPPSPPPRKSSQGFRRDSEDGDEALQTPPRKSNVKPPSTSRNTSNIPSLPRAVTSPNKPPIAPRRPSRDGTPDFQSQLRSPVRIIHSNLSSSSLPGERRGSTSEGVQTHSKTRNASTSQLPSSREISSAPKPINIPAKGKTRADTTDSLKPSSAPISSGSSFRFPFFGLGRKKAAQSGADSNAQSTKKEADKRPKIARKGPVAGTGHEGYGRVGNIRRRSGSGSHSRTVSDHQTSQDSLGSADSFFADRMNPVVIAGGEIIENRNTSSELSRTESNQSLALSQKSFDSVSGPGDATISRPDVPNSLRVPRLGPRSRRPSESSDSDSGSVRPTLAYRRSAHKLRVSPDSPISLPQLIITSAMAPSPMTSFDTSIMSDESFGELQHEISHESDAGFGASKRPVKRSRSPRKWNLFGRSQSPAKKADSKPPALEPVQNKSVAFYAMLDSPEKDNSEATDIRDILRTAEVFTQSSTSLVLEPPSPKAAYGDLPLPAPAFMSDYDTGLPPAGASSSLSSGRPSRLKQVGRIPRVVSHRHDPPLSPHSFSRPFRRSMTLSPQDSVDLDPNFVATGLETPIEPPSEPAINALTTDEVMSIASLAESAAKNYPASGSQEREFIRFSPRKNSECTVGTSSSSGACSFNGSTAVIPQPNNPPTEDEIWDEYNDLLGEGEDNAIRVSSSIILPRAAPFPLSPHKANALRDKPMESPTIIMDGRQQSTYSLAPTNSSCYSADMTERIRAAFQPHDSPEVPSEEFPAQEEESESLPSERRASDKMVRHSLSPVPERNSDSSFGSAADDGSPLSQVNLRVGSMTVSKWLTFGHVLFSDVRHELINKTGSLQRHGVLVIDGLGNDDWSFYAAETYPQASFFNLSPRAPLPAEFRNSSSSFPLSPPNHHQIQYTSALDKFPFAPQSFTAVVYRFPIAAPESHYRNILSEARRVLKPGGYLELSILDFDLNNMGQLGRRAVRQLKERIHESDCEMNLASTADLIVRHIGKAGFSNIRAARVGVPVASPISKANAGVHVSDEKIGTEKKTKKSQPSLSEMMSDNSSTADESITKMVARVGRWWYTRCYETAIDPTATATIWNDKQLLKECEQLGTSLKLMVCCSRAPDRVSSI
ncbi:unnamed protein product [Clonostachys chloroleuca]|uniref:Methyltransferase type 11 domain-containing protein n=1 Tax=Clonostachys chloroleuca TaxID=1926264 RepID=A0AA35LX25_9HYPO|nr:unnamed protein product [Clonostachys chloroleuca]